MGQQSRVRQLRELLQNEQADIVGLQETIKQDFSQSDLEKIAAGGLYSWKWVPAIGHSGGILLGVKEDRLEVESWETNEFYVGATIRHRLLNIRWDFLTGYGPANHALSPDFIRALSKRCEEAILPLLIGGDFNLIRVHEVDGSF